MKFFGLATEGVTDQAVLKNILHGYLSERVEDLEDEITLLQPAFDKTTQKQDGFGSWTGLIAYLSNVRFREDVINHEYVIIQIDTDITNKPEFDIPRVDENGAVISIDTFIESVKMHMINIINNSSPSFYDDNQNKIIFCITVHSIECWLNAHHEVNERKARKIESCETTLQQFITRNDPIRNKRYCKEYSYYNLLSAPLRKRRNILGAVNRNISFEVFINNIDQKIP